MTPSSWQVLHSQWIAAAGSGRNTTIRPGQERLLGQTAGWAGYVVGHVEEVVQVGDQHPQDCIEPRRRAVPSRGDEPPSVKRCRQPQAGLSGLPPTNVTATAPDACEHFRQLAQALIAVTAPANKRLTSRYAHHVDRLGITSGPARPSPPVACMFAVC